MSGRTRGRPRIEHPNAPSQEMTEEQQLSSQFATVEQVTILQNQMSTIMEMLQRVTALPHTSEVPPTAELRMNNSMTIGYTLNRPRNMGSTYRFLVSYKEEFKKCLMKSSIILLVILIDIKFEELVGRPLCTLRTLAGGASSSKVTLDSGSDFDGDFEWENRQMMVFDGRWGSVGKMKKWDER
ncbi:hypothetical protein Fot_10965 [Forsythia ovata]|uniref:Uncharacterized protein n=1 Tax=Forsythia ovata TaxID=205694 RepID=A0ABD1WIB4_9LAMI